MPCTKSEERSMPEDQDDNLSEEAKQLYRKRKVPHKFCPNCGHRNEAEAQRCANCDKDISWMKIPEQIPAQETPYQPPRSLPEQRQPVFTWRAILVFILVLVAIAALILVIYFTTRDGGEKTGETVQRVVVSTAAPRGAPGVPPSMTGRPGS